jgi:translation initiation factor 2 subunit 2
MLDEALKQVPKVSSEEGRLKVPEPDVETVGNRTTLRNLKEIANALNRKPNHLMKYLLRELGTAGNLEGTRGVFQGRFWKSALRERIDRYVEEFVICRECGKPDTEIVKEERIHMLKCEACGAKSSVRGV